MRLSLLSILGVVLLAGCAPATGSRPAAQAQLPSPAVRPVDAGLRAAFSEAGVAWVSGGRACVARVPSFRVSCPRLPAVVDVAWHGGEAWAALPGLGAVVTLDGAARSVTVGRVVALSAGRVYREDGSAVTYAGAPARGVVGGPQAAVTDGEGQEFALLAGQLRRVADGSVVEAAAGPFLVALPVGARTREAPEVVTAFGAYRVANGRLEALDAVGVVRQVVAHGPALVGVVGAWVVTVSPAGQVRVFGPDLHERALGQTGEGGLRSI